MQPMSVILFFSSIAFYPFFSSLYYYLLLHTGQYPVAIAETLCTLGIGLYLGAWLSQHYGKEYYKKFLSFAIAAFTFGAGLLLFFKFQLMSYTPIYVFLCIGILLVIYGISTSLLLSFTQNWAFYVFWGLLIGIFWQENALLDTFGYPGILLTMAIFSLLIGLFLWLFRQPLSREPALEQGPIAPEWDSNLWFFVCIFVQCLTLWAFWNTARLAEIGLNDTEFTHSLFLLTAIFNLGIGARYGHVMNNGKRDQAAIYRHLILFGILLFLVLANNKWLLSFPQMLDYNTSIRSQHAFILVNLLSAFLITLPLAAAGQVLSLLYQLGFYRFMAATFISLVLGTAAYFGLILPYLGVANSLFYSIYLLLTLGIILYCRIAGVQRFRYYILLYLFLSILLIHYIYKHPVLLDQTASAIAIDKTFDRRLNHLEPEMSLDGHIDSVRLLRDPSTHFFYLMGNGHIMAEWSAKQASAHEVVGVLTPVLAATQAGHPKTALVMGLKEGLMTEILLEIPSIAEVKTIENETAYIQIASQLNYYPDIFSSPRSTIQAEDYRSYLQHSNQLFDVILLNTDHYWKRHQARFYSQEFYQMIAEHLSERGIFAQTINLQILPPPSYNTLMKTLASAFTHLRLYLVTDTQLVVLASKAPIDNKDFTEAFSNKVLNARLHKIDIATATDLQARFFADEQLLGLYLDTFTRGNKEESLFFDYFPFIEAESAQTLKSPLPPSLSLIRWGIFPPIDYLYADQLTAPEPIRASAFSQVASNYHTAEAIYQQLQHPGQANTALPQDVLETLSTLDVSDPAYCADLTERHIWLHAYLYLIEHTLPYLSTDKMRFIVNNMRQHPCHALYADKPDLILGWLSLHAALLANDYEAVLKEAKRIYDKNKNNISSQISLTYILLAEVKLKQFRDALNTWAEFPFKYMASDLSRLLVQEAVRALSSETKTSEAKASEAKTR